MSFPINDHNKLTYLGTLAVMCLMLMRVLSIPMEMQYLISDGTIYFHRAYFQICPLFTAITITVYYLISLV